MLSLKSVATLTSEVGTLLFDEVDTGIGGITATGLGERLARLAARTQILCITHLPQVVAFAERHFAITKVTDARAGFTETVVRQVEGEERIAELCRMLGQRRTMRRRGATQRACWPAPTGAELRGAHGSARARLGCASVVGTGTAVSGAPAPALWHAVEGLWYTRFPK